MIVLIENRTLKTLLKEVATRQGDQDTGFSATYRYKFDTNVSRVQDYIEHLAKVQHKSLNHRQGSKIQVWNGVEMIPECSIAFP